MLEQIDLTTRSAYPHWCRENLRFSDTDMLGHVNNVAFAALIESGRTALTHDEIWPQFPPGKLLVTARLELDYRAELHWPSEIDIGARLTRIGRSSFVLANAVFHGDTCAAIAHTTLVMIDRTTRRSTPLPQAYRAALEAIEALGDKQKASASF